MKNNNSSRSNSNNSPSNTTTNSSDRKKAKIRSKNERSPNSKQNDLVAQLQLQGDHYMLKIEEEKQCIDRLERDLEDLEKKEVTYFSMFLINSFSSLSPSSRGL